MFMLKISILTHLKKAPEAVKYYLSLSNNMHKRKLVMYIIDLVDYFGQAVGFYF